MEGTLWVDCRVSGKRTIEFDAVKPEKRNDVILMKIAFPVPLVPEGAFSDSKGCLRLGLSANGSSTPSELQSCLPIFLCPRSLLVI